MKQDRRFTHAPRITSLHNVLIPPKKKQSPDKFLTVRFVLVGTIPSKKNMIWADSNVNVLLHKLYSFTVVRECVDWLRKNLKVFVRNSKKYKDWMEQSRSIIVTQASAESKRYEKFGLIFPLNNVSISVYHYWADNMERDLTNKLDTINDLLVSCGIIANDNWQVVSKITSESELYRDIRESITTIDITQRIYDPCGYSDTTS